MHDARTFIPATVAVVLLATVAGCAATRQRDASAEDKRSFLLASVAEQAATGAKDCQLFVHGLKTRLARAPFRYDATTLYYCSLGAECHVVLQVDTGEEKFASDNGAFIEGHIEELAAFNTRRSRHLSWRQVDPAEARLMLLAERFEDWNAGD